MKLKKLEMALQRLRRVYHTRGHRSKQYQTPATLAARLLYHA